MHIGYISFCDRQGLNVKSHEEKERIKLELENKWNIKIIKKHYIRLTNDNLFRVNTNPHLVCLRTNGNPYYLFLTKDNFTNQVIFIDKKIQAGYFTPRMILSKLRFADDLFENGGTLFEGEMLKDMYGNWVYLIHDLMVLRGEHLNNETLVKRISAVYDLLRHKFIPDDCDVCTLQVKKYVPVDQTNWLVNEFMPTLPYTCRGLYFKPLYLRLHDVLYNFDESLIKKVQRIKYQEHKDTFMLKSDVKPVVEVKEAPVEVVPVDEKEGERSFLIEKTHLVDVYKLYDPTTKSFIGYPALNAKAISKKLQHAFRSLNLQAKLCVRCEMHPVFKRWVPKELIGSSQV
jgi:hypothetical protein